ncbi:glycoside hydrolase family 88/105 protein [Pedobacter agri]|uniref:glycoside hydrolase family 88/105 protein n=1 Tax=Pedobacter agri TaxID=454586 RepID=UPI002784C942|nr:glycoside hydrolase family 88 protein [Pedobacter agri]MDQ1142617.1 unsaturated rhamnogalacturonyl hydrolase [Pedobacter agri]
MLKKISIPTLLIGITLISACAIRKNNTSVPDQKSIKTAMRKVFNWQVANPVVGNSKNHDDWARGVFYAGIIRAYETTKDKKYFMEAVRWSESLNYKLAERYRHADDHTRGQTYLGIYAVTKNPKAIADTRSVYDSLINNPKPGREEWWWCDALFMSPPVLVRLAEATGNQKYNKFMSKMWWDTTDFLFDRDENLFYRDKSFFQRRSPNGKKIFWSRGNGWVMGGLVQVLEHLPKDDPGYKSFQDLYLKMAEKIASLQQEDGLWRPNLADPAEYTNKETSGSAFYVFALTWGINHGYLNKNKYMPVVLKGWRGLNAQVTPEGKLTWVQKIGSKPEAVKGDDNQEYGSGAFLMAGSELLKLK